MDNAEVDILDRLLADAEPLDSFLATQAPAEAASPVKRGDPSKSGAASRYPPLVTDGVSVVEYLIANGTLELGLYTEWTNLAIAWKHTYGESGYASWLVISKAADGFDSEQACRVHWDGIKPRADGPPLTMATYFAEASALGWRRVSKGSAGDVASNEGTSDGIPKRTDAGAYAIELAIDAGDEFWIDQEGGPHVTYSVNLPKGAAVTRNAPIASGAYAGLRGCGVFLSK